MVYYCSNDITVAFGKGTRMGTYSSQYLSYYLKSGPKRYSRPVLLVAVVLILAIELVYIAALGNASSDPRKLHVEFIVMGPMLLFFVLGAMLASQILDEQVGKALDEPARGRRLMLLLVDGVTFLIMVLSLALFTYVAATGAAMIRMPALRTSELPLRPSLPLGLEGEVNTFIMEHGNGESDGPGFYDDFGDAILWMAGACTILMVPLMLLRALRDPLKMVLGIPKGLAVLCLSFAGFFVVLSVMGYVVFLVYALLE